MNDDTTTKLPVARRPRRKTSTTRKPSARSSAGRKAAPAAASEIQALRSMLKEISTRASRAGSKVSALGTRSATAARKAMQSTVREWKKLDTPRRVEFVATLLAALAATSGAIARGRQKR